MKRSAEFLSCTASVIFHVALAGWFFSLAVLNHDFTVMRLNFILISAVALAGYFINYFMISRGVPAAVFAAAQILLVAGGAFAYVSAVTLEPHVTRTVIISCGIYCTSFPMTAYMAYEGPGKTGMYLRFDIITMMVVILLVVSNIKAVLALESELLMCGIALALILVALVSERAGRYESGGGAVQGNAWAGRLILIAVFAAVALLTGLIAVLASSGVKSFSQLCADAIVWCIEAVKAAVLWLYGWLERFFTWLTQFIEVQDVPPVEMDAMPVGGDFEAEEARADLPGWIYYILAGVGAALLGLTLYRLRHAKVEKVSHRVVRRRKRAKRQSNAKGAFAAMLRGVWDAFCFRLNCVRYRKTAPGLLVWCEKRAAGENRRRPGESGEEFLLRLAGREGEEGAEALCSLATLVEKAFYSPHSAPVPKELYRQVRKLKLS